jgi:predicted kinase
MNKVLFIVRGLPGSGKTTFAHFIWSDFVVCEADKYFYDKEGNYNFDATKLHEAHKWCQELVETYMQDNAAHAPYYPEIVVSNTSTTEKEMKPYFDLAEKYGYSVISLIVENRHGNTNIHNVPSETLDKMKNRFDIKL